VKQDERTFPWPEDREAPWPQDDKEGGPAPGPQMTATQARALVEWAMHHGQLRRKEQGKRFSEADYLAGAMTAFFALQRQGMIPASWIFGGPLVGRTVFPDDKPPKEAKR
jgi:hypothetical protein